VAQATTSRRRSRQSASRSRLPPPFCCDVTSALGASPIPCTHSRLDSASRPTATAAQAKACRSTLDCPAWSSSRPTRAGPTRLAAGAASDSQPQSLRRSWAESAAMPARRCTVTCASPMAPPTSKAAAAKLQACCQAAASKAPDTAIVTASRQGRCRPWRSTSRPQGRAMTTLLTANKAISTPASAALWPWCKAYSGMPMRSPVMQAWIAIWPAIRRNRMDGWLMQAGLEKQERPVARPSWKRNGVLTCRRA